MDRSCVDVISRCVVLFPASFYPSFSNVQYVWKPLYTHDDNVYILHRNYSVQARTAVNL